MINKGIKLRESCYKLDENGKIVCYEVCSDSLRRFNSYLQTKTYLKLPDVQDLSNPTPTFSNGYSGWALHFMYYLQSKGVIGKLSFEEVAYPFKESSPIEKRVEVKVDYWLKKQKDIYQYCNYVDTTGNNICRGGYKGGTVVLKYDHIESICLTLFIKRDFNDNSERFNYFLSTHNLDTNKPENDSLDYYDYLVNNKFISGYKYLEL